MELFRTAKKEKAMEDLRNSLDAYFVQSFKMAFQIYQAFEN